MKDPLDELMLSDDEERIMKQTAKEIFEEIFSELDEKCDCPVCSYLAKLKKKWCGE